MGICKLGAGPCVCQDGTTTVGCPLGQATAEHQERAAAVCGCPCDSLMGSLVKTYLPRKLGIDPVRVSHISLMPCFDKKLEASRDDFLNSETGIKDVDCVITTLEVEQMLQEDGQTLASLQETRLDSLTGRQSDSLVTNREVSKKKHEYS